MAAQLIGAINALTSVAISVVYLPCLKVIGYDPELKNGSCFRFMFHVGISDLLLLLVQFIFAVFTALDMDDVISERINCAIAPLAGLSWFLGSTLLLFLSINRLTVVLNKMTDLFSKTKTTIFILFAWVYSIAWTVVLESEAVGYCYYPSTLTFYFGLNTSMSALAKQLNWAHNQVAFVPSILCYLIAFYVARSERKAVAKGHQQLNSSLKRSEYVLLKQGALIFGYGFVESQYWHLAPILFEWGFGSAFALGNWLWLTTVAVNPVAYLSMANTIYTKVAKLFGIKVKEPAKTVQQSQKKKEQNDGAVIEDVEG